MICNKKDIGDRPTLEQLTIRIWQKKVNVSAMRMYEYYEKNNWQKKSGEPLKNLDSAIGGFNNIDHYRREPGELREEKRLLQNTDEWKKYTQEVHQYYHNECQKCGKKGDLEVHHWHYYYAKGDRRIPALLPWEYPMQDVVSLCHACHEKEQGVKGYSEHEKLSGYK